MTHCLKKIKSGIILILCMLLLLLPVIGQADLCVFVPGENANRAWLEDGRSVLFFPESQQLRIVENDGTPMASFDLGQEVERVSTVYADAERLRVLATEKTGRVIYDIQGNDLKKYALPEEQILGLVFLAKNGAYYRTPESAVGYFDLRNEQASVISQMHIGGLYCAVSGKETDYLAVSVPPTGEKHILAVQDGSAIWDCVLESSSKNTLIDDMAEVDGNQLIVAADDMTAVSGVQLSCLADGQILWQKDVFVNELDFPVDKILIDPSNHVRLIGTYQNMILYEMYDLSGAKLADKNIKMDSKCPFNVFLWIDEEFYIVDSTGNDLVKIGKM